MGNFPIPVAEDPGLSLTWGWTAFSPSFFALHIHSNLYINESSIPFEVNKRDVNVNEEDDFVLLR